MLIYAEAAAKFFHQTLNWKHFVCISFLMEVSKQISQINSWLASIASFMGNCEMNKIRCHMISCASGEILNLCAWRLFINVALLSEWWTKLINEFCDWPSGELWWQSYNWSFMIALLPSESRAMSGLSEWFNINKIYLDHVRRSRIFTISDA